MQSLPDLTFIFHLFFSRFISYFNNALVGIVSVLHLVFIVMGATAQIALTMLKMKLLGMRQLKLL